MASKKDIVTPVRDVARAYRQRKYERDNAENHARTSTEAYRQGREKLIKNAVAKTQLGNGGRASATGTQVRLKNIFEDAVRNGVKKNLKKF